VTLRAALDAIKAEPVVPAIGLDAEISGCFAADLMSDVLAFARTGSILVTGLTSDQTIRTAAIKRLSAVVIIQGKTVGSDMIEAAREQGVGLYQTPLSKYEACGLLMQAGVRPYRKTLPPPESSRECPDQRHG
jgi:hypothetical protein